MAQAADVRPPGWVPASIAAGIAFAATVVYVTLIVLQGGDEEPIAVIVIAAYLAGLGVCALIGGRRSDPDRVIPLGAATGGLIGSAMIAIFSIGLLLLPAGACALAAWMRASVGATRHHQLLGGAAAVAAPLLFLFFVLFV
jgi:hypothetical protein